MSLRDKIKAANVRKITPVRIAEWDLTVYVRSLVVRESIAMSEICKPLLEAGDRMGLLAVQMATYLCDEHGEPQYTVEQAKTELVEDGMSGPLTRIMTVANEQNGQSEQEQVRKNS